MILLNRINYRKSLLILGSSLLLLLVQILEVNSTRAGKVTATLQGDVRGRTSITRDGRFFTEYWGIPYAKTAQRFELARPGPKWDGIKECSKKPPPCFFQTDDGHAEGTEDCLFLNVHTPQTHNLYYIKNMPVIVIIHGGFEPWSDHTGYFLGAKYFLDKDVVLVSFNYRLGAFGFFTTQDETMHANLGLKDQVLALKWVQKNIHFFGGDPNSVTLLGYGSGAASAHMHMMSRMSKGLFHKVIAQSGSALSPWAFVDDPEKSFSTFVTNLACDSDLDSKAVVECLRGKSAEDIVKETYRTQRLFSKDRETMGNAIFFGPVIEHWMRNWPEWPCFLHDFPQNILANASAETVSFVPLLLGVNQYDGVTKQYAEVVNRQTSMIPETSPKILVDWSLDSKSFSKIFGYKNKLNDTDEIDVKVDEFYFKPLGDKWIRSDDGMTFFQALSHRNYFQGTRGMAVAHAKHATNVFLYYISYFRGTTFLDYWARGFNVKYDMFKKKRTNIEGPTNGDELQYLFDLDEMGDFPLIRKTYREMSIGFSKNLILLWVNFAKTGIPEADWEPLPQGADKGSLKWYSLGDERMQIDEPFRAQVNFWDDLLGNIVYVLPPLKPKNETQRHRKGTGGDDSDGNGTSGSQEEILDIIYVDAPGDDDGTGGLFEWIDREAHLKKKTDGPDSNKVKSEAKDDDSGTKGASDNAKSEISEAKESVEAKPGESEISEPEESGESKTETIETKGSGESKAEDVETKASGESKAEDVETKASGESKAEDVETKGSGESKAEDVETKGSGESKAEDAETKGSGESKAQDVETKGSGETKPEISEAKSSETEVPAAESSESKPEVSADNSDENAYNG